MGPYQDRTGIKLREILYSKLVGIVSVDGGGGVSLPYDDNFRILRRLIFDAIACAR